MRQWKGNENAKTNTCVDFNIAQYLRGCCSAGPDKASSLKYQGSVGQEEFGFSK
jgi:hypothetical protein